MNTSSQRNFRAFTLVEMLVVLAIVAILASLLLAAFHAVREQGRRTVCLSNQHQILLALQVYTSDSGGTFPYALDTALPGWVDSLLPYTSSPQLFICPDDDTIAEKTMFDKLISPGGIEIPAVPSSYIANGALFYTRTTGLDSSGHVLGGVRSLSSVAQPSSTIFLSDGSQQASPTPPYWTTDVPGSCTTGAGVLGYTLLEPSQSHLTPVTPSILYDDCYAPSSRHSGRANVAFVDGHVKSLATAQWYFPVTPYLNPSKGG